MKKKEKNKRQIKRTREVRTNLGAAFKAAFFNGSIRSVSNSIKLSVITVFCKKNQEGRKFIFIKFVSSLCSFLCCKLTGYFV